MNRENKFKYGTTVLIKDKLLHFFYPLFPALELTTYHKNLYRQLSFVSRETVPQLMAL